MTQYYNFEWRDNQSAPYEFSPVIDGEVYFCEVGYSSGSGAFVLTVKSSFQEVVCIQNLISSCDCGDIPLAPQLGFTDNFVFRGSSRCFEVGGVFRECPDFEQPITPVYYPPDYAIVPDTSTINETDNNVVTFTVTTANVFDGTILYYTVLDITTEGASDLTPINGSVVIVGNTGEFSISAITDYLTEGSEGFQVQLRTNSIAGVVVATSILITIVDSSNAISYAITSPPTVNEGDNLSVTVATVGIPDNTTLFWTVLNGTTSNADFSAVSGSVVIASNTGSFNIAVVADLLTEGSETFTVQLRTGSISGSVVATSDIVTINDTSTLTYTLTPSILVTSECNTVTVTIPTTGVPDNTTLYWTILHDTTNNSDFSSVSGSAVITTNSGSFTVFVVPDFLTEGSETFQVQLRTGSTSGDVVATSPVITITDTSIDKTYPLDLRFIGTNGSTTFIDSGLYSFPVTRYGNTVISTAQVFPSRTSSGYFDGVGDFLTIPNNTQLQLLNKDFEISFAFYRLNSVTTNSIIARWDGGTGGRRSFIVSVQPDGRLYFGYSGNGIARVYIDFGGSCANNTWQIYTIKRVNGVLYGYRNCELLATANIGTVTLYSSTDNIEVGATRNHAGEGELYNVTGYLGYLHIDFL